MTTLRHQSPPLPFGCRWCGIDQRSHGRQYVRSRGMHAWERPTNTQIIARMKARRAARLSAAPASYHAVTGWAADIDGESGVPYCADCRTDGCRPWMRVQDRLDRQRWGMPNCGGWGGDEPW